MAPFAALRGKTPEEVFGRLATPCYILDESALRQNGELLAGVAARTGCRLLLAQKAFTNYDCYPILAPYLCGTEASGLFEARLGKEELPEKEVHVFCAAYRDDEFEELLRYADHIVFNSPAQLARFGPGAKRAGKSLGLRINPECSTQEGHAIYDPCAPGSRLGTTRAQWDRQMTPELTALLDGLHFHTLCEQDSDALEITLRAVAARFGDVLPRMRWLNLGGGHHVTRPGYDIPRLERCIRFARETWDLDVYLEPGEAWALNAGFLASRVLDRTENNGVQNAILDCSAACHMPDVIEMPYQPPIYGAEPLPPEASSPAPASASPVQSLPLEGKVSAKLTDEVAPRSVLSALSSAPASPSPVQSLPLEGKVAAKLTDEVDPRSMLSALSPAPASPSPAQSLPLEGKVAAPEALTDEVGSGAECCFRLGGPTCLAGDVVGDYRFDRPLEIGDLVLFGDLAIYSTNKNNTFNGMPLPDIWRRTPSGELIRLTAFGYADFKYRLGASAR